MATTAAQLAVILAAHARRLATRMAAVMNGPGSATSKAAAAETLKASFAQLDREARARGPAALSPIPVTRKATPMPAVLASIPSATPLPADAAINAPPIPSAPAPAGLVQAAPEFFSDITRNAAKSCGQAVTYDVAGAMHGELRALILKHADALEQLIAREKGNANLTMEPRDAGMRWDLDQLRDQIELKSAMVGSQLDLLQGRLGLTGLSTPVSLPGIPAPPASLTGWKPGQAAGK